ncbi:MAG: GLPGLI family protein [Chitinophagaceae bacterium]
MKKTIFPLLALAITQIAIGQMKEGKVIYENVMQLNFQVRGGGPDISNLPKTQTRQFELLFGNNQSLYQALPDIKEEANQMQGPGPGGGPMVNIMRIGGDAVTYHNFETGKRVSEREMSAKTFIVEENISKLNWKLTEESKVILGHRAFKATAERYSMRTMISMENGEMARKQVPDTSKIVAWFASDIPVPAGPDFQGQLPGLILELDINNGRAVYTAIELSPKVSVSNIKAPSRGKKISADDFAKEQQKMFDQMQQQRRGGSGERITITAQQ